MGFAEDIAALGREGAASMNQALQGRNSALQPFNVSQMFPSMANISQGREQKFLQMYSNKLLKQATESNQISVNGQDVNYSGTYNTFPTLEEAWNDYRTEASRRGLQGNYAVFKELYGSVAQEHNNYMSSQIHGLTMSNVSTKSIKKAVSNNPDFQKHLIRLSHSNPELAASIQAYMPSKSLSTLYHENPTYYQGLAGAAGIGTTLGLKYLNTTPADIVKEARGAFVDSSRAAYKGAQIKEARALLRDSKNALKKMNKAKYYVGSGKTKAIGFKGYTPEQVSQIRSDVRESKKLLKEAQKTYKAGADTRRGAYGKEAGRTRYKRLFGPEGKFGKWGAAGKAGAYMFAPFALQAGVSAATGSERAGQYAGAGGRGAIAGVSASGYIGAIREYIKRKGGSNFLKLMAEKGGRSMALSLLGKGILTGSGIGAIVSGGLLMNDLRMINNWIQEDLGNSAKRSNRVMPEGVRLSDPGTGY